MNTFPFIIYVNNEKITSNVNHQINAAPQCYKISQQPENCENRNDPDLAQAFLKKWWVESYFKAPNLPLSLRLKDSDCDYNSIYNNTGTK